MEQNVYICSWAETIDGLEVWVTSRPHIRAYGKTQAEACESLVDVVISHGGALHPVFEFAPPLPTLAADRRFSQPALCSICGDERFETEYPRRIPFETSDERMLRLSWYDQYFSAPICRSCQSPRGPRNSVPLPLTHVRSAYDGGFICFAGATLQVFSATFLELLTDEERQRLRFQPVGRAKSHRKDFFELVGPPGPSYVAVKGLPFNGWHCKSCGVKSFGHWSSESSFTEFIARADLPEPLPDVFTVGSQIELSLCLTERRLASIVGSWTGFTTARRGSRDGRHSRPRLSRGERNLAVMHRYLIPRPGPSARLIAEPAGMHPALRV